MLCARDGEGVTDIRCRTARTHKGMTNILELLGHTVQGNEWQEIKLGH